MERCLVAIALAGLTFGCGGGSSGDDDDTPPIYDANPLIPDANPLLPDADPNAPDAAVAAYCTPQSGTNIKLTEVASGLSRPVLVTAPAGDPRAFIVEHVGRIKILQGGQVLGTPFLDIDDRVINTGGSSENGLLGLAFHPNYASNGRFFVHYNATGDNTTVIAEYHVSAGDPNVASRDETRLITVSNPYENHNGGSMEFGPDGFLYIGLGDGGGSNDFLCNGQNINTLMGSILRIDVDSGSPYGIPASNPFASGAGADEIYAYGLRNPWRFSFDPTNGDLYVGDVGQGDAEEVNVIPFGTAGLNFGWNEREGMAAFGANECTNPDHSPYTDPIAWYSHGGDRCSITGGYVYRGGCLPDLQGAYFYGDYCSGQIWSLKYVGGAATAEQEWSSELNSTTLLYQELASFGRDGFGELYVTSLQGRVYRIEHE